MDSAWLIVILVAAVIGNIMFRCLIKKIEPKVEGPFPQARKAADVSPENATVDLDEVLARHGEPATGALPQLLTEVSESFKEIFERYSSLRFPGAVVLDSKFLSVPFKPAPNFVQIGYLGDGSEILVRLAKVDEKVYVADIDGDQPSNPTVYARSLDEYLRAAWLSSVGAAKSPNWSSRTDRGSSG